VRLLNCFRPTQVLPNGWHRATAVTAFVAEAEGELSLAENADVRFWHDGPAPAGWVYAVLSADAASAGLVSVRPGYMYI